jgi:predicted alpha/beta hydrolase family esterase
LKTVLADNEATEVLLVGHSIGCQTILRYLAQAYVPVGKVIFVAGWIELTGLDETEQVIARPWLEIPINIPHATSHLRRSVTLFSTDDPVVPLEPNRTFFKDQVGSEVVTLDGYSHFDEDAGVMSIPELLQHI